MSVFRKLASLTLGAGLLALVTACGSTPAYVPADTDVSFNSERGRVGCWVEVYEKPNFQGRSVRLHGPLELASLNIADLGDWRDRINSLRVGPSATAEVFGDANFKDRRLIYPANRSIENLEEDSDFGDNIASLKIIYKP